MGLWKCRLRAKLVHPRAAELFNGGREQMAENFQLVGPLVILKCANESNSLDSEGPAVEARLFHLPFPTGIRAV